MTKLVLSDKATAVLERLRLQSLQGVSCGYCKDCKWWRTHRNCWRQYETGAKFRSAPDPDGDEKEIDVHIETRADFGCVQFAPKE